MGFFDFFKRISTITNDQAEEMIREKDSPDVCILDVRQPGEYESGHIAGATLVPVGQLKKRMEELDPEKTTIVYCAMGGRSHAAASMLTKAGFKEVYNLKGGMNKWKGGKVTGSDESGNN